MFRPIFSVGDWQLRHWRWQLRQTPCSASAIGGAVDAWLPLLPLWEKVARRGRRSPQGKADAQGRMRGAGRNEAPPRSTPHPSSVASSRPLLTQGPGATPSPTRGEGGARHLRFGQSPTLAIGSYVIGDGSRVECHVSALTIGGAIDARLPLLPLWEKVARRGRRSPQGEADAQGRMRGVGRSAALQAGIVRVANNGVELLHRRAPRSTPHPSPFPVPCLRKGRGRHLLPQGEKGERGICVSANLPRWRLAATLLALATASDAMLCVDDWWRRRCQAPPSPLVGEGGPACSPQPAGQGGRAGTDEGCWTERGPARSAARGSNHPPRSAACSSRMRCASRRLLTTEAAMTPIATTAMSSVQTALISGVTPSRTWL